MDVMQSSGGIVPARLAAREPVRTVLSGPAGGVVGACQMARWAGFDRIIGFDMGGTSTDVFLADAAGRGDGQDISESVMVGVRDRRSQCWSFPRPERRQRRRWPASMEEARCGWDRSPRAPIQGRFVLGAALCRQ